MMNRMVRAAQLDVNVYEEVERDVSATSQAAMVVLAVAVATGIGQLGENGIGGLIFGIVMAFVSWVVWSAVTYFVGTRIFKTTNTRASLGEMLRTLGFAQSPGVLNILAFVPLLGPIIGVIAGIWVLITGVIAIRQALDFTTGRAIATALVGFVVVLLVIGVIGGIVGIGVAGV